MSVWQSDDRRDHATFGRRTADDAGVAAPEGRAAGLCVEKGDHVVIGCALSPENDGYCDDGVSGRSDRSAASITPKLQEQMGEHVRAAITRVGGRSEER